MNPNDHLELQGARRDAWTSLLRLRRRLYEARFALAKRSERSPARDELFEELGDAILALGEMKAPLGSS
jgi:hypothetical protein